MFKKAFASILLLLAVTSLRAAAPTITIDATSPAGNVSRLFYGLMTEEINHSYDGGLYAELVAGDRTATNSIDAPRAVSPATSTISGVKPGFTYTVPAHAIVVLTLEGR